MIHLLVSGSTGFIGSNFLSYFNSFSNYKIINLVRSQSLSLNDSISWELDGALPDKINTVLHFAGLAKESNKLNMNTYFEVNTKLSVRLFKSFLSSTANKFVFMSSVKAVTDNVSGYLTEDFICKPGSFYGRSKYQAECEMEKLLIIHNSSNPSKQKLLYILRPCIIHGPGNKGNMNLLFQFVKKGLPWPLGTFENKRSFCSIDNLLFILKELIERDDIPSGVYNVADDESYSTNELIDLIATSQNKASLILKLPQSIFKVLAQLGDILHLPLNSERLGKLTSSYLVSNSKIKNVIGKPLPFSTKEGLLKTFKSFNN